MLEVSQLYAHLRAGSFLGCGSIQKTTGYLSIDKINWACDLSDRTAIPANHDETKSYEMRHGQPTKLVVWPFGGRVFATGNGGRSLARQLSRRIFSSSTPSQSLMTIRVLDERFDAAVTTGDIIRQDITPSPVYVPSHEKSREEG